MARLFTPERIRSLLPTLTVSAALSAPCLLPLPAYATFHLNEISKIMVGFNGDPSIQAIELKMLASSQHLVNGTSIKAYDAAGVLLGTLGTFGSDLANGIAGQKILCATNNFATTFGITPDLLISPGIPVTTGQISFESPTCLVNAIAYGAVTAIKNGKTVAPPIPTGGATVLARVVDDPSPIPSCPLDEDANARFLLVSGSSSNPVLFTNNRGASASVFTTMTGVEGGGVRTLGRLRVYPNPVQSAASIESEGAPLSYVTVYNVSGKLIRRWGSPYARTALGGPSRIVWDATDEHGRRVPSGIYFVRSGTAPAQQLPIVLLR